MQKIYEVKILSHRVTISLPESMQGKLEAIVRTVYEMLEENEMVIAIPDEVSIKIT